MQKLFENWRQYRKSVLSESAHVNIPGTQAGLVIDDKVPKKLHKQITKTVFQATKDLINSYKTGGQNSKVIMNLLIKMSAGKSIEFGEYNNTIKTQVGVKNVKQLYKKHVEPVFLNFFRDGFGGVYIAATPDGSPAELRTWKAQLLFIILFIVLMAYMLI